MPSTNKVAKAIEALDMEMRTPERIFAAIRQVIEKHPASIGEIFPDHEIVRRKMTTAERVKNAAKSAALRTKKDAGQRAELVKPIIQKVLDDNPQASLAQIKNALDKSGIKPARAAHWNRSSINKLMKREGLITRD
jgi:hypothetical protein